MRLDQQLYQLGLAPSRSKAQELIRGRAVEVLLRGQWCVVEEPSWDKALLKGEEIRIQSDNPILKYVSRGGIKLESALRHLQFDVSGMTVLDVGQSTGGFTDCLLKHGAARVVGVDVGQAQLSEPLRAHPQVTNIENLNIKDFASARQTYPELSGPFDLCVIDVSFISLTKVLPVLGQVLTAGSRLLALVKPQFEVGPTQLNKAGVVVKVELWEEVESNVKAAANQCGFQVLDYFPSGLKGQDGNQEFFLFAFMRDHS